jgi:ribosome modulation factor
MGRRQRDETQRRWTAAITEGAWAAVRGEDADRCPYPRVRTSAFGASPLEDLSVAWHRGYQLACDCMRYGTAVAQSGRPASDCELQRDWERAAWLQGWRYGAGQR